MSLGKNQSIVQDAESFCKLAKQLNQATTVTHVSVEGVEKYKDTNPFADSVPVNSILKMHVMQSDGVNSHLWLAHPTTMILNQQAFHYQIKFHLVQLQQSQLNHNCLQKNPSAIMMLSG